MSTSISQEQYATACNYPGQIDVAEADRHLSDYVTALGIKRRVSVLDRAWWTHDALFGLVNECLAKIDGTTTARDARAALDARAARVALDARAARAARDALDARAARDARAALDARDARVALDARAARVARDARVALDARDARDALDALAALDARDAYSLRRFGNWCMWRSNGLGLNWDISWICTLYFGSKQYPKVRAWSEPMLRAYLAGAWFLIWTEHDLFWVPKPEISTRPNRNGRLLHNENGPACASTIENLYFLDGLLLPAHVVICPEKQTVAEIEGEDNNDVRSIRIARFAGAKHDSSAGWARYLKESGAQSVDTRKHPRDGTPETLYVDKRGSKRLVVTDPSTSKLVALGVPREVTTCAQAQAWVSHGSDEFAMCRT